MATPQERMATIHERVDRLGFENLLPEEQDWLILWELRVEVENGTFHQYFFNSSGDDLLKALEIANRLGAKDTVQVLQMARDAFGEVGYSSDREERWRRMKALPDKYTAFNAATKALDELEEYAEWEALRRVGDAHRRLGIGPP